VVTYYDQNGTGPHARRRQETLVMAKTSPSKRGAPAISESIKAAPANSSASRAKGRPAGEGPRPLLEVKAPPAKTPRRRGKPAAAKGATDAPEAAAPPRAAKDKAPAPRRADGRSLSEI